MPIIFILLLALLIGTLGFWDALGAILGAVALFVLFWILVAAAAVVGILWLIRRITA
ncbi:hypothetical protein [Pelagibacterium limicola]|uniref:hypothetical protein n=1 Tax=Pelagibacterium limicola TaxID=2791022 RepID=UPI0018AFFCE0|nr:hypothetical protein [Pelagibacterium limicola]